MKERTEGFLRNELIPHESEQFDYISELHDYLWQFIKCEIPGADGNLKDCIDMALQQARTRAEKTSNKDWEE